MPEEDIHHFKTKNKVYLKYGQLLQNTFIISREELHIKLKDVFDTIGSGFDVYVDKNNNKSSFIDFYSSNDSVGVVTDNEKIVSNLFEKVLKLKSFVNQGLISKC